MAAAASVLIACIAGAMLWWQSEREPAFSTDVGEQRSIALADGSTVELNSRSRIRVRFTSAERVIDLLEGQALFQVASNPNRPFIVHSGAAQVRAVGTQFDVYRTASGTIVTVLEGRVAVLGSRSLELAAGEQVTMTADAIRRPKVADVAAATAWRQRELVFNSTPLGQVAEEFNRYNKRRLTIGDSGLSDFHITGVFSSTDPTSLLRFLRLQPGIRVHESEDEIRISVE
jgi:transmembrane sensor